MMRGQNFGVTRSLSIVAPRFRRRLIYAATRGVFRRESLHLRALQN